MGTVPAMQRVADCRHFNCGGTMKPDPSISEKPGSVDVIRPLLTLGDQMANMCFALKTDKTLPVNTRRILAECQRKWDAARTAFYFQQKQLRAGCEEAA